MSIATLPKLQPGIALVLTGPPGCGKSTLARELAEQRGAYVTVDADLVNMWHHADHTLRSNTRTIIIDGVPTGQENIEVLKELVAMCVRLSFVKREGADLALVICARDEALPPFMLDSRHFDMFHMPVVV
jgi:broad-specificity NMP kinase